MRRRDFLTRAQRSRLMARIRSFGTGPELEVREILYELGIDFRAQARDLPGTPDFVIPRKPLAVFVNGDFWHGRIKAEAYRRLRLPWRRKLERNVRRDARVKRALHRKGWSVLTIWESDLRNPDRVRRRILRAWRAE